MNKRQTASLYRDVRSLAQVYAKDDAIEFDRVTDGIADTGDKLRFLAAVRDAASPLEVVLIVAKQDEANTTKRQRFLGR